MSQKSLTYLSFAVLFVLVSTFFIPVFNTNAFFESPTMSTLMGGRVEQMTVCTCSFTVLITVGGPAGGDFMVTPMTTLYANYNFTPGQWVLGLADQQEQDCMVYQGNSCSNEGSGKPITIMGTS